MLCAIGLGSNLGDRLAHLEAALRSLHALQPPCSPPMRCSSVYETAPVGCPPGSGAFLNMAVLLEAGHHDAASLMESLLAIETTRGRIRPSPLNSPRQLDLDILLIRGQQISTHDLQIPHPRLAQRAFVLLPLAEIAPDWRVPPGNQRVADLLAALPASELQGVRRVAPALQLDCHQAPTTPVTP